MYYYLMRAPWAASSQAMQDESGAKSGNWLAEFVHVVSTSFSILFSWHQFEASTFFVAQSLQKKEHLTA